MADITTYNITVYQGSDIKFNISLLDSNQSPINLNGFSTRGQVRASYGSDEVLLNLNPTIINSTQGFISIDINGQLTSSLPIGEFRFDIEKYPTNGIGEIIKIVKGKFSILPEVTR